MSIENFIDQMRREGLDTETLAHVKALGNGVFTCRYHGKNTVTTLQTRPLTGIKVLSVEIEAKKS